jgi:hypothetical protein
MPILLEDIRKRFLQRLKTADSAFDRHIVNPSVIYQFDRYALQEGLISNLWQAWNLFCRDILIASAQGANTTTGALTTSPYSGRPEAEISYVSEKLSKNQSIGTIRPLAGRHLEPTWGDADKINRISIGICASNSGSLASAFSGVSMISDLQVCRNACAHLNSETIASVIAGRVRYNDTFLRHPSQMIFWSDPMTKDFAWKAWIDEMILVADFAVV